MAKRLEYDRRPKNGRYSTCYSDDGKGGPRVYDRDVAAYVKKHTTFLQRLDYHRICDASIYAFVNLWNNVEDPFGIEKNGKFMNGEYSDGWADYPGVGKVYDTDVAAFVKKHTHWWDRLDYHMMCDCAQMAFDMLIGVIPQPKEKNWKF